MTSIIMRSALVFHDKNPAPDVHSVLIPYHGCKPVIRTWSDVMRERQERQAEILENKRGRQGPEFQRWRLTVSYFDQFLMGGWQVMLDRLFESVWVDRDRTGIKGPLMRMFPLVLDFGDNWGQWKEAFAHQFERRRQDRQPVGVANIWFDGESCVGLTNEAVA